jgi:hypothetical protein
MTMMTALTENTKYIDQYEEEARLQRPTRMSRDPVDGVKSRSPFTLFKWRLGETNTQTKLNKFCTSDLE